MVGDASTDMTSVKDLRVEVEPQEDSLGRGSFEFSDRYSVFDWGEMPDLIPGKGASLCTMGAFNFELLEAEGVPTHYEGVRAEPRSAKRTSGEQGEPRAGTDGDTVPLVDADDAPTEMVVGLTQVPDLPFVGDGVGSHNGYDYETYHAAADGNYLVPLEVVFRNSVPVGSSLRRRRDPGEFGLDVDDWPAQPVELPEPVVEFSTKYEERDRYLPRDTADEIAGEADVSALETLALAVNRVVTERAERTGFTHEDGKVECLYVDGEVRVADVVGTFDENRFAFDGREVSKEVVRQYYRHADPEWVDAVAAAKQKADDRNIADWRTLCASSPAPLPDEIVQATADMYAAGANRYTDHEWFDPPALDEALSVFEA